MDFVVSDDGELNKYNGPGGDVVIPEGVRFIAREGVFDPSVKITALHLPSSLLGHRYDNSVAGGYEILAKPNLLGASILMLDDNRGVSLTPDSVTFYPLSLDLPCLETFTVDDNNKVYSVIDGALIFNDSFVVDIPKKISGPLSIDCSYFEYMQQDASERSFSGPPVIYHSSCTCLSTTVIDESYKLNIIKRNFDNLFIFYAPDATGKPIYEEGCVWTFEKHMVIVAPKSCLNGDCPITNSVLMGYCYKPELYGKEGELGLLSFLEYCEPQIYTDAARNNLVKVCKVIQKQVAKAPDLSWIHEHEWFANSALINAVLYSSLSDLVTILKLDYFLENHIIQVSEFKYQQELAVRLACRYGGVEKLKCLLNNKRIYTSYLEERKEYKQVLVKHDYEYGSWAIIGYSASLSGASDFFEGDNGEVRGLTPISAEERLQCLDILLQLDPEMEHAKGWLLVYAILLGCDEVASKLVNEVDIREIFRDLSEESKDEYKVDYHEAIRDTLEHNYKCLIALADHMIDRGLLLCLDKCHEVASLYDRPDVVSDLFGLVYIHDDALFELIEEIAKHRRMDTFKAALLASHCFTKKVLKRCQEIAIAHENTEMSAIILDYQESQRKERMTDGSICPSLTL